ncbi:MAG: PD40 domain-containing protein [Thermoleophilia bacterium]|nr:PD40 domain-containing protein [Thermoleophilia bacterium]
MVKIAARGITRAALCSAVLVFMLLTTGCREEGRGALAFEGAAVRLTDPPPEYADESARWTSTADAIYFVRCGFDAGEEVWRVDLTSGDTGPVCRGGSPAVSPDGTLLAFENDTGKVEVLSFAGGSREELDAVGEPVAWSPDGRHLAYFNYAPQAIRLYDFGRGTACVISEFPARAGAAWNPDASALALAVDRAFSLDDPLGPERYRLVVVGTDGEVRLEVNDLQLAWGTPSWSPDGRSIVVSAYIGPEAEHGESRLYQVDVGTGEFSPITSGPHDYLPKWSPNGRQICYTQLKRPSANHGDEGFRLVFCKPDGSDPIVAGPRGVYGPVWSPDSRWVACRGLERDGTDGIWLVRAPERVAP